jgi:allantoicase
VFGTIDTAARRQAGYRWFNALPARQAIDLLTHAGLALQPATALVAERPLREGAWGLPEQLVRMLEGK